MEKNTEDSRREVEAVLFKTLGGRHEPRMAGALTMAKNSL